MENIEAVQTARRAVAILGHPLRRRILELAREPVSAAEIARRLELPRQRVNYHVRQLEREGLLTRAARVRRRNMVEQQYRASAHAFLLTPTLLGGLAPAPEPADSTSADQILAVAARTQGEVGEVLNAARAAGVRLRTFSRSAEIEFASAAQRAEFTQALTAAVDDLVARYTSHGAAGGRRVGPGGFRLVVAVYPIPGTA